ncbi:hypothetical protein FJW00_12170 [Pantoea anthophila]|uniref:Uncharacterized protein n=1 Tax=Pantoea anthophila TaxID=470931 RepID=A0ABY2Z724_9GAMM|nr:hypothetical protein FJW00_12170 [Pantoea anthophila]
MSVKKIILLFLAILMSLLSLYSITDLVGSLYLISRYEHFIACSLGLIAGKAVFIAVCVAVTFILVKIVRRCTQSEKDRA